MSRTPADRQAERRGPAGAPTRGFGYAFRPVRPVQPLRSVVPPRVRVKVVLFSGGRGASSIATALAEHPQIDLTVLVNTYDDGLSTGRLRQFIPGMLGPSDVRKNISTLSPGAQRHQAALKQLLDHRLPQPTARAQALETLALLATGRLGQGVDPAVAKAWPDLLVRQTQLIGTYCGAFLRFEAEAFAQGRAFDYGDCSVGNLLFAGCFLDQGRDFNRAVAEFSRFCEVRGTVLNVTDGTNYVLTAVTRDGRYLPNEASIVSPMQGTSVEEIFLLDDYLPAEQAADLAELDRDERLAFLRSRHRTPRPHPDAIAALETADLVVYGPGTQNSSLLPSYLTAGVAEAIASNRNAKKVFVSNIAYDHDIEGRGVDDILQAFLHAMGRKGEVSHLPDALLTHVFVQAPDAANLNRAQSGRYVKYDVNALGGRKVRAADWEAGAGRHSGGQIVDELLSVVQELVDVKIAPFRHTLSIVVPALDEARTVRKVLADLERLDVSALNLNKEIILVDGGSSDGTVELARLHPSVRVYSLPQGTWGRGEAVKLGISKARGNVVVLFPADDEYDAADIVSLAEPIVKNQYAVVFGSRTIKCVDVSANIRAVYGEHNRLGYWVSKYGGMAVSMLSLALYNRFVSDPFSTLKAFDGAVLKALRLGASGVDLDAEVIAKLARRQQFILEVPVQYRPRTRAQGKKTRMGDGLRALATLVWWSVRRDEGPSGAPGQERSADDSMPRQRSAL